MATPLQMLHGRAELRSSWFSDRWTLRQDGELLATMERIPRLHITRVQLADGTRLVLEPHGWGIVRAVTDDDREIGRAVRRSWIGRRWDLVGVGFGFELISRPRPRRWVIAVGGAPFAELSGSLVSYNRVTIECTLAVPLVAVLLAWHVIARPWEAAAAPRALVPKSAPARVPRPGAVPIAMEERP